MLYIHIPYCHRKCSYCAFYSVAGGSDMERYADALCEEMRMRHGEVGRLRTVYFGGGTPTRMGRTLLGHVVEAVERWFDLGGLEEATIEANPEDLTDDFLAWLQEHTFFNRLSIGVQSFCDDDLRAINRIHDAGQAVGAVRRAAAAGFSNLSIDLIMGLPGQSLASWKRNLDVVDTLLSLGALKHISCYELTVEEGTILDRQLKSGRVRLPEEDDVAAEYEMLLRWCRSRGFVQYEVSNFALDGWHSRHNSGYWEHKPYLGVGAGAHSFDGRRRRWNLPDLKAYIDGVARGAIPYGDEVLSHDDLFNEFVMTALRTSRGIDKQCLATRFPEEAARVAAAMEKQKTLGLIEETEGSFRPTPKGLLQADGIAAVLLRP